MGAALDPPGKAGLANMVSALLDEGAGELDSQTFQERLQDLAIDLRFVAGYDTFAGSLRTLTENRDAAFDLLRLALTAPRFDPEPVERIQSQILAGLRQEAEDVDVVAARALFRRLFPGHPYGRPSDGTLDSVATITEGDLQGFVGRRLARDNLVVGAVGDVTPRELGRLLDATFGGLPETAQQWRLPEVRPRSDGATVVIEKPVPQSAILFATEGVKRDDPDFYAAFVMNHVFGGGGFTSRLYQEVRERRGLAYSVYTYLNPLDHTALLLGGAGTANARVGETLDVVRTEWRRMAVSGLTARELADAKRHLTGSFPLRFTSSRRIATMLVNMQLDRLDIDYLDRRNGYIEAVTRDDANRTARRLLDEERLSVVVVGQPEGLSPSE